MREDLLGGIVFRRVSGTLQVYPSQTQGYTIVMSQLHGGARKSESHAEKDGRAARGMVSLGSDEGDESAENQSCEKATDVCSIISDAVRSEEIGQKSPGQVEGDKYKQTSERAGQCGARH